MLPNYEQPYEALFEQTNDAVVILDPQGIYVAVNKRTTDLLGYNKDELIGQSMAKTVKPTEYPDAADVMSSLLAAARVPIYERCLIRKDGKEVFVEINASLVRDDRGEPAYFQVVARDITERKLQDDALRLVAEVIGSGTGTTFFSSMVRHLALALDVRCAFVTECARASPRRARMMTRWPDQGGPGPLEYEVKGTPSERVLSGELVFERSNVCGKYPDDISLAAYGAQGYLGIPLRDPTGEVIGHLAVIDDKPMDDALRDSALLQIFASRAGSELARSRAEERFRILVEQLPAITYVAALEQDTPALYISPQIETVLGFTAEEFAVRPACWRKQLHPDDRQRVVEQFEQAVNDLTPFRAEYRIYREDGSLAWIRDEAAVVMGSDGTPLVFQGIMLDITVEKRLTDELLNARKLESVGILAGGIAHDFNNSLMGILGNLSIAKTRAAGNDAILSRLLDAEKAAVRARGLTQQLLTFSKGGSPVRKPTSIEGVIRDTVQFVLSGSNARAQIDVAPDLWTVHIDAGQISQVIENLTINAVQAMPNGGRIEVEAVNSDTGSQSGCPLDAGRFVCIRVRDEGVGIAPDVVDRIFDPYFTTKQDGLGLGLATSYSVVQKHDGYLGVKNRPEGGTEFTMCLPVSDVAREPDVHEGPGADVRVARILVMDDDDIVLDAVREMLRGLGHDGEFVTDGESAVQAYEQALDNDRPFDAVLLDLTIRGGFGGEETMRRLLRIDPGVVGIVSSGYSDNPVMAEARRYGFSDGIAKPYRPDELAMALNRALGKRRSG